MIRIEGIPVVAARLAAELKSTKTVENPTRFRRQQIRPSQSPSPATTVRARRPRANAQKCT
jgi:hypothetical protein